MRNFLIILFLISNLNVFAQTYPIVILPNSQKMIESGTDTLWILNERQLKKAIISAKKLKIEEEISNELRNKISLMQEKDQTIDSIVVDLKTDRDYYMNNWKDCTNDVDLLIRKNKRQKIFTRFSQVGIIAAFIVGILVAK